MERQGRPRGLDHRRRRAARLRPVPARDGVHHRRRRGTAAAGVLWDDINAKNEGRADKNSAASKADVLGELREGAASTAAYVRRLSDEQLDRAGALKLAGGASVSTQQLIEGGVLIDHVRGHMSSLQSGG